MVRRRGARSDAGAGTQTRIPRKNPAARERDGLPRRPMFAACKPAHRLNVPRRVSVPIRGAPYRCRHPALGVRVPALFICLHAWAGNLLYPDRVWLRLTDAGAIAAQDERNSRYISRSNLIPSGPGADICAIPDGARLGSYRRSADPLPLSCATFRQVGCRASRTGAPSAPGRMSAPGDERPGYGPNLIESGGTWDPAEAPRERADLHLFHATASMIGVSTGWERGTVFILGARQWRLGWERHCHSTTGTFSTNLHVVEDSPSHRAAGHKQAYSWHDPGTA